MITGALLLPVRGEASVFYKKRIPRVFFPFLIWSVIYNLFPWITGLLGLDPKIILDFCPLFGRGGCPTVICRIARLYSTHTVQLLYSGGSYVVYLSAYRSLSVYAHLFGMGREGFGSVPSCISCWHGELLC